MTKILTAALFLLITTSVRAATCPNLSGFWWHIESDKPQNGAVGRMFEFKQEACNKIVIYVHLVDINGKEVWPKSDGYVWNLGTPECSNYQQGVDCRSHPYTETNISTVEKGVTKHPVHGLCSYNSFDLSLDDKKNMIETTPVICADGFNGILTKTIERAR